MAEKPPNREDIMSKFTVQLVESTVKVDLQKPITTDKMLEIIVAFAELGYYNIQGDSWYNDNDEIIGFGFKFVDMPVGKKQVLDIFDICFTALMLG